MKVNRRTFVTASVSGAAVTATGAKSLQRPGPNDRIRVGCIGVGGMGRMNQGDFQRMPEVDVVAVCDVWDHNRDRAVAMTDGKATAYQDSTRAGNSRALGNRTYGVEFFGTDGTLFINRGGFEVMPEVTGLYEVEDPRYIRELKTAQNPGVPWEDGKRESRPRTGYVKVAGSVQHVAHVRNFIDCVKSREKPASDIETGHYSTSAPHLANIALKLGRKIEWDWKNERIIGDAEANRLLTKQYRSPWKV